MYMCVCVCMSVCMYVCRFMCLFVNMEGREGYWLGWLPGWLGSSQNLPATPSTPVLSYKHMGPQLSFIWVLEIQAKVFVHACMGSTEPSPQS